MVLVPKIRRSEVLPVQNCPLILRTSVLVLTISAAGGTASRGMGRKHLPRKHSPTKEKLSWQGKYK